MKFFRKDAPLTPSWDFLNKSITLLKANPWPAIYLSLLPSLIAVVGVVLVQHAIDPATGAVAFDNKSYVGVGLIIAGALYSLLAYPGAIAYQIDAVRGGKSAPSAYFKANLGRVLPFFALQIVMSILLVLGFVALIVPGLILLRGLYLAQYHLIDEKLGPIAAIKRSFNSSRPHAGYIWGTIGVTIVFSFLGSAVGQIPVIGYVLTLGASLLYYFGAALRYDEIKRSPVTPAPESPTTA